MSRLQELAIKRERECQASEVGEKKKLKEKNGAVIEGKRQIGDFHHFHLRLAPLTFTKKWKKL